MTGAPRSSSRRMVFGNASIAEQAAAMLFTAHPYRKVRRVAAMGRLRHKRPGWSSPGWSGHPISVEQARIDGREEQGLERLFPKVCPAALDPAAIWSMKRVEPQESSSPSRGGARLVVHPQTRDMITIKKKEHLNVFVDSDLAHKAIWPGVSAFPDRR